MTGALLAILYVQGGCSSGVLPARNSDTSATAVASSVARRTTNELIPAERRTTWNPGLSAAGGIPRRTVVYKTLSPTGGDDTASIQAALAECPDDQVVKLAPGDFRISGEGLAITRSHVTLRGSGGSMSYACFNATSAL